MKKVLFRLASGKYKDYLKNNVQVDQAEEVARKRKLVDQDLGDLKDKRNALQEAIDGLLEEADVLGKRAEEKHEWLDLSKANAFRVSAKEKKEELAELEKSISSLKENRKKIK